MKYRKYRKEDRYDLVQMVFGLYEEDALGTMDEAKIDGTIAEFAAHPDKGEIVIIEKENEIAGYAILVNFWSNEMGGNLVEIDELFIKKDQRGTGLATEFIKSLADKRYNGAVGLTLGVTQNNKRAKALYKRLGFEEDENTHMYLPVH